MHKEFFVGLGVGVLFALLPVIGVTWYGALILLFVAAGSLAWGTWPAEEPPPLIAGAAKPNRRPLRKLAAFGAALLTLLVGLPKVTDLRSKELIPGCEYALRPLSESKFRNAVEAIKPEKDGFLDFRVFATDPAVLEQAKELFDAFRAKGWDCQFSASGGSGHGVRIVSNQSNAPATNKVQQVLDAAGLSYGNYWLAESPPSPRPHVVIEFGSQR